MIDGQALEACIELLFGIDSLHPTDKMLENSRLKIELTQAKTEASNMKYPEDVVLKLGERLRNEVHKGCLEGV